MTSIMKNYHQWISFEDIQPPKGAFTVEFVLGVIFFLSYKNGINWLN